MTLLERLQAQQPKPEPKKPAWVLRAEQRRLPAKELAA